MMCRRVLSILTVLGLGLAIELFVAGVSVSGAQQPPPATGRHAALDLLLDLYVRDGLVYYRALASDRSRLDRYVAGLDVAGPTFDSWAPEERMAFLINAYNSLVLKTVVDRYPIRGRAGEYPSNSIRQIPGAFEKTKYRVAGRSVTLDEIEKTLLVPFAEPRVFLALGRGSLGGGRLRSEAFQGGSLDKQLGEVMAECIRRDECAQLDRDAGVLSISPVFGWREAEFSTAYGDKAVSLYESRSPIERAVLALLTPYWLPLEREYLQQNQFRIQFSEYDWRLNDLTDGGPR